MEDRKRNGEEKPISQFGLFGFFYEYFREAEVMEWIKLFPTAQEARQRLKENKPQLLVVNGIRICLVMREDRFFAVADRCTHNGESLSKGIVNYLGDVICPWHGYRFNLKTGREASEQSADLVTYPVEEREDGVYIGI